MGFVVKNKGRNKDIPYLYEQHSKRVGGKVKTPSRYIGPLRRLLSNAVSYGMLAKHEVKGERDPHKLFEKKAADDATKTAADKVVHEARFTFSGITALHDQTPEQSFRHEAGLGEEKAASDETAVISDASVSSPSEGGDAQSLDQGDATSAA